MDLLFGNGPSTAAQVMDGLPDGPGYSAVRTLLRILEEKGRIRHEKVGPRFVYHAITSKSEVAEKVLKHTVSTFFKGSVSAAVIALLDSSDESLSDSDLERLEGFIESRRQSVSEPVPK
jgi:BlaI family penicillinase repressor